MMRAKTKCLIGLIGIMIVDTLPIPVLGLFGLYIIFNRPPWFENLVHRLYHDDG